MNNNHKILIIDDELGPREAMRMILKDYYDVATAASAREGLEYLLKNKTDLVILDIKMPDMDGIAALKKIKEEQNDIEVIMVTAYASVETARSAIRYGALDYLIKPFDKDDVLNIVKFGLAKRQDSQKTKTDYEKLLFTNKYLEEQVGNARQNFLLSYEGTIKALIYAIDAKDHYTFNHSDNVAKLSMHLAEALGFSALMKNNIKHAALIHDIGKIGIDEMILRKEGSLTDLEFKEIKKHPTIGLRIVQSIPFIEEASQVILYHHERFDGTGYPEGIKGDNIPVFARVVAIADAVDAMLRNRPYRKALSKENILNELKEGAGTQFDPDIAKIIIDGAVQIFEE